MRGVVCSRPLCLQGLRQPLLAEPIEVVFCRQRQALACHGAHLKPGATSTQEHCRTHFACGTWLWLGFRREHLATLRSIMVMIPLGLLMMALLVIFVISNALAKRRTSKAQDEVEKLRHEMAERTGDVFDKATSALDNSTEARAQVALEALTQARTTFVIAHRLSTVRNADLILVLDGGRRVEQGKYDELLPRDGLFAQLDRQGRFKADADCRLDKSL